MLSSRCWIINSLIFFLRNLHQINLKRTCYFFNFCSVILTISFSLLPASTLCSFFKNSSALYITLSTSFSLSLNASLVISSFSVAVFSLMIWTKTTTISLQFQVATSISFIAAATLIAFNFILRRKIMSSRLTLTCLMRKLAVLNAVVMLREILIL